MKTIGMILVCLVAAGIIAWLVGRLLHIKRSLRRLESENHRLLTLLQTGTQMADEDLAQLRQLRHDLRQYLTIATDNPLSSEAAALQKALASQSAALSRENWAISALERYYTEQARVLGFQVDLLITPPCGWDQAVPDIYLILSNLLENSLEALQREGGGWMRARSISTAGYFSLVIGNSCTHPPRSLNGHYLSSKAPARFGIGLSTVQKVVQRYGGQAEFTCENGEFRASVFLPHPALDPQDSHPLSAPQDVQGSACSL